MKEKETPETYPMFKDKIDKYLWEEHHIIGGCCSSVESLKYAVAREVTEKLTDAFIEKACEFMRNNIDKQLTIYHEQTWCKRDEFIERFKNYMRGE